MRRAKNPTPAGNGDPTSVEVAEEWGEREIFERISLHSVLTSLHPVLAGVLEAVRQQLAGLPGDRQVGSLADLIVAVSTDAPAIVASDYPLGTFRGVNIDGLDPLKVAALHSLFTDKGFHDILGHYRPVAEASASGPWLIKFPAELIAFLGHIAPQDHGSVAAKWAATYQVQEEGWSEKDTEKFLDRVVHFAQIAAFEGKDVFLCVYS